MIDRIRGKTRESRAEGVEVERKKRGENKRRLEKREDKGTRDSKVAGDQRNGVSVSDIPGYIDISFPARPDLALVSIPAFSEATPFEHPLLVAGMYTDKQIPVQEIHGGEGGGRAKGVQQGK